MTRPPLTQVAVRFTRADGAALVLTVDPPNGRIDVSTGNLDDVSAAAREAILAGVPHAVALERKARGE